MPSQTKAEQVIVVLVMALITAIGIVAGPYLPYHKYDMVSPGQVHHNVFLPGPGVTEFVGCTAATSGRYCTHSELRKPGSNEVLYDLGIGNGYTKVVPGYYDHVGVGNGAPPPDGRYPVASIKWDVTPKR